MEEMYCVMMSAVLAPGCKSRRSKLHRVEEQHPIANPTTPPTYIYVHAHPITHSHPFTHALDTAIPHVDSIRITVIGLNMYTIVIN